MGITVVVGLGVAGVGSKHIFHYQLRLIHSLIHSLYFIKRYDKTQANKQMFRMWQRSAVKRVPYAIVNERRVKAKTQ